MLDVYHFDQLLTKQCLELEKYLQYLIDSNQRVMHLRFVPVIDEQFLSFSKHEQIKMAQQPPVNRQQLAYRLALDFKAALLEGNKKARHFLMHMQEALVAKHKDYSEDLVQEVAEFLDMDTDDFLHNRMDIDTINALIAEQSYVKDNIAHTTPSILIENYRQNLAECFRNCTLQDLKALFEPDAQTPPTNLPAAHTIFSKKSPKLV